MPEVSRFFDSTPEDLREYSMSEFAEYFQKLLTNGVFNAGTNLQVSCSDTDINTTINAGYAWIKGYMYKVYDSSLTLTHDLPDPTSDRIDRIVIRLDTTIANRYIKAFILRGTPSANPQPPTLTRNDNIYEISLAQVRIIHGKSYIEGTQIIDERLDNTVCGLVNSLIQADTTNIFNQFRAWYNKKTAEFQRGWNSWWDTNIIGYENNWNTWFTAHTSEYEKEWTEWLKKQQQASGSYIPAGEKGTAGGVARQDDFTAHMNDSVAHRVETHIELDACDQALCGTKKADSLCWRGQCVYANTPTSGTVQLTDAIVKNLRFGNYSITARLKTANNTFDTDAIKIDVQKNISGTYTSIATTTLKSADFNNTSDYQCFYAPFDYAGSKATDNQLKIVITLLAQTATFEIDVDSIVIVPANAGWYV